MNKISLFKRKFLCEKAFHRCTVRSRSCLVRNCNFSHLVRCIDKFLFCFPPVNCGFALFQVVCWAVALRLVIHKVSIPSKKKAGRSTNGSIISCKITRDSKSIVNYEIKNKSIHSRNETLCGFFVSFLH